MPKRADDRPPPCRTTTRDRAGASVTGCNNLSSKHAEGDEDHSAEHGGGRDERQVQASGLVQVGSRVARSQLEAAAVSYMCGWVSASLGLWARPTKGEWNAVQCVEAGPAEGMV